MFETFEAFLEMGGYASYVWPSYAICFGGLILLAGISIRTVRRRQAELEQLEGSRERRTARAKPEVQNA